MTLEPGTRRGFLIGALALMTAPAIVRADSLMKIVPIDVYDTRCLVDYDIGTDTLVLRVDRRLETMLRPTTRCPTQLVGIDKAKLVFRNHPIFDAKPIEGRQVFAMRSVSRMELVQLGYSL